MTARLWSPSVFRQAARTIAAMGQRIHGMGWSPATSSNYSQRLNRQYCAITVSGKDKGVLSESDIMEVDFAGQPHSDGKPSAETALHTQLYRHDERIGAVLHTHSLASTVLTMHYPETTQLSLAGYELLKALAGVDSHDCQINLPIFDNTQDIDALATQVEECMNSGGISHAYLIRGHGLYTWATDMASCYRQLEALEVLLAVELERRKLACLTP